MWYVSRESISTRRCARRIAESAAESDVDALDLSDVEFVSRSVADELLHQSDEREFELRNAESDVATMLAAVGGDATVA